MVTQNITDSFKLRDHVTFQVLLVNSNHVITIARPYFRRKVRPTTRRLNINNRKEREKHLNIKKNRLPE